MATFRDKNGVTFQVDNEWMKGRIRLEFGIFTRVVNLELSEAKTLADTLSELVQKGEEFQKRQRQSTGGFEWKGPEHDTH